jgi:hypothetical protein
MKAKDPISLDWPTALLFSFFFLSTPLFFFAKQPESRGRDSCII